MTKLEFSKHTNIYFWNLEQKSLESWDTVLYPVQKYLTGNKRLYCGPWMELIKTNIDMFIIIIIYHGLITVEVLMNGLFMNHNYPYNAV